MPSSTTRVILVRHGRSTFNQQGRYQGSSNSSVLTAKGLETARLVGTYLNRRFYQNNTEPPIDLIYTSPLRRVQQTAKTISDEISSSVRPPVVVNHDLKEISLSLWEGLSYDHVKQAYSEAYRTWQHQPEMFELPISLDNKRDSLVESSLVKSAGTAILLQRGYANATQTYFPVRELYQAAQQFWCTVLPQYPGRTLLVVSHSGTIHALISTALGLSPQHHHSLQQSNCGISELTFRPNSVTCLADQKEQPLSLNYNVQLHQLNQTSVLGEMLPKIKTNKKGLRLLLLPSDSHSSSPNSSLTVEDCERLAERIQSLPLDFCIAANMTSAKLAMLMQHRPHTMYLEAQTADFLKSWQQQLVTSPRPAEPLMTALVIAPAASIQETLLQTLGAYSPSSSSASLSKDCIQLRPHHLSIIHYPYQYRPVVQAINTFSENAV
ncbi:MAG: histidine phosphatase family protein [Cyanobacteria bacterium P01_F01_bin.3]